MIFKFSFAWRLLFLYKTEIKYFKKNAYTVYWKSKFTEIIQE